MKKVHFYSLVMGLFLSANTMAQKPLTEDGEKAQKALMEYLRSSSLAPTIDTRDNSVCFKKDGVFFWITFEESAPVKYTIHRKGINFTEKSSFQPSCAFEACNELNKKSAVKCIQDNKKVEFVIETFAQKPTDFHGGLSKMLAAFKDVDKSFRNSYEKIYDKWKKDSIAENAPITPDTPVGKSPLNVTYIAFGNFNAKGEVISDFNQPLRKSACRYIRASLDVSSTEKGIFKVGMKLYNPNGKEMVAAKGLSYCSTKNVEIKKTDKPTLCELDSYGSDKEDFWKAGEYKVEIYDFEKGVVLYKTTFNIL